MKIANLSASALILVGVILRFVYLFTIKFNILFMVLTLYLILFDVILILSILQNEKVLYFIRFLNSGRGIGLFMIFLCLLVLGRDEAIEIMCTIAVFIIALINICLGAQAYEKAEPKNVEKS